VRKSLFIKDIRFNYILFVSKLKDCLKALIFVRAYFFSMDYIQNVCNKSVPSKLLNLFPVCQKPRVCEIICWPAFLLYVSC